MLIKLKTDFVKYIAGLGYKVVDNGIYNEDFPWIMLRTNRDVRHTNGSLEYREVTFMIDIFSTYTGEKEILEISQKIGDSFIEFLKGHPYITYGYQGDLKVIDDKSTGPVRKHGVISYRFILVNQKEENDG